MELITAAQPESYISAARIIDGEVTIDRIMYFQGEVNEGAADVMALGVFPQKGSAHPKHPQYKYYGNATVEPMESEGRVWRAVLEYSTSNPNQTDVNGKPVTSETAPWNLKPDSINFSYPETTLPFDMAYDDKGNATIPVLNSAGDPLIATKSVCNAQMSFTFATKKWDVNNSIEYGETINSSSIKVCGITIGARRGLLKPPEASFITVYEDGSSKVKWQYWSVTVTIVFDLHGNIFERELLNVGDRAKFKELPLGDDPLLKDGGANTTFPETKNASQICSFRKTVKSTVNGKSSYLPLGDVVFCSWDQYIAIRQAYLDASTALERQITSPYELQCEQQRQMPLDNKGYIDTDALTSKKYYTANYKVYPSMSWGGLNLPKTGAK